MCFCWGRLTPVIRAMLCSPETCYIELAQTRNYSAINTATQALDPGHLRRSALALLVLGITADDIHHTAAANNLAVTAYFLDRGLNFHCIFSKRPLTRYERRTEPARP